LVVILIAMANPVKIFLKNFLKALKDGMTGAEVIHTHLQELAQLDCSIINETTARKLNLAMRKHCWQICNENP
jgi:hypothetical protein